MLEYHCPVMLKESVEGLLIREDGIYVDVTFGGGGHSREILNRLGEGGRLYAFDQDEDAIENAKRYKEFSGNPKFLLIDQNFSYMKNYLRMYGVKEVDGILADLGVSSHQFDVESRGFSIRGDGPLDMRMDRRSVLTAAEVVNAYTEERLAQVLRMYGELFNAGFLAREIVRRRQEKEFSSTGELVAFLENFAPRGKENKFLAMVFQALRIEVNGEMKSLESFLMQSQEILKPGGRLVVLSYHSLEDRLVKNVMKTGNPEGELKKDFYGNQLSPFRLVNRKVILSQEEELKSNTRSRSAKLRIAEKKYGEE